MPTQTYFRLPEEKRERLCAAAWSEFTAYSFAEASINRIVRQANIPRGSFYQYFEDKADLFFFLLSSVRDEALAIMRGALEAAGGDPFGASLRLYDAVFPAGGEVRASMRRVVDVLRRNQDMDMPQMVFARMGADPGLRELHDYVDWKRFRQTDEAFLNEVTGLLVFSFAHTLRNILCVGSSFAAERAGLNTRLDVLRRGSMKEETL